LSIGIANRQVYRILEVGMVYILIAIAVVIAGAFYFRQPVEPQKVRIPVETIVGRQKKQ